MAKAKAKAAVKRKPAKTQTRAAVPRAAKTEKTAGAKAAAASAAKPSKAAVKASAAVARTGKKAPVVSRDAEPLTLPTARPVEPVAAKPPPVARKIAEAAPRADLPPAEGFTLLVDGHYKNNFDDLKGAKAAASELKDRFPMLRVEIYDAAKRIRLPA